MVKPLEVYKECGTCGGDGMVEVKQGDEIIEVECPACEGGGYVQSGIVDGSKELNNLEKNQDKILKDLKKIKKKLDIEDKEE
jgi:DnaJ-class molecular chaperone